MIDTVLIELNNISVPETLPVFKTSKKDNSVWQQYYNPTSKDYHLHGYLPNVTVVRFPSQFNSRWHTQRVVIQASVPKVIHGTNYFGVTEQDFDIFVKKLTELTNLLGLPLTGSQLAFATLRDTTFCFNFFFPVNFPYPIDYLKKMSFLDIGKRYKEVKNTNFIEEVDGYSGKFFNPRVGFGLYDKRLQIINDAKTPAEFEVAEQMKLGLLPDRVLRMEVTYQNQTAVKQHLATKTDGNKKQKRYLKDIFNNSLAKSILLEVFDKLADDVTVKALEMPIISTENAYKLARESGMSAFEADAWIGHSYIIQQIGSLPYKEMHDRQYPRQRRYDLGKRYKQILTRNPLPKFTLGQIFNECRKQLLTFKIAKPADFIPADSQNEPQLPLIQLATVSDITKDKTPPGLSI